MSREPIGRKLRFEVFKRDRFVCQYCGATPLKSPLQVDHIIPVAMGGTNHIDNLVTACQPCNAGKAAVPLSAVPQSLAERAAETAEREEQIAGYAAVMEARRKRVEADVWRVAVALCDGAEDGYPRASLTSIERFVAQLGVHAVLEAADLARSRFSHSEARAFRYFCGICWKRIREADR